MTRPMYESQADRGAEQALADRVALAWRCSVHKMPMRYSLDYALKRDGRVVGFAEMKQRSHFRGHYPTYMIALSKWAAGLDLARITTLPALLVVGFTDGPAWTRISPAPHDIDIGGRADRNDWQDTEPVVHVPINLFRPLGARS